MDIILAVNDDARNLVLLTTQLLMMGLQVATATVEDDAVELANRVNPRLILMELRLAKGNGWDAARKIRALDAHRSTPIIVVSAQAEDHDIALAKDAGADEFIAKPYDIHHLKTTISRYLNA